MNNRKEINIIYFIIQEISSIIIIYIYIINNLFLLNLLILLKIGVPPIHNWLLKISIFLNWKILFIVINFQKIIPLNFVYIYICNSWSIIIILNLFITIFFLFNVVNNKYLYSVISLNSLRWIILLTFFNKIFILIYLFIYFHFNYFFLKELMLRNRKNFFNILNFKTIFFFITLNIISFPPTLIFLIKIKIIFLLSLYNFTKIFLSIIIVTIMLFSIVFFLIFLNHFFVIGWKKEKFNIKLSVLIYLNILVFFIFRSKLYKLKDSYSFEFFLKKRKFFKAANFKFINFFTSLIIL